MSLSSCDIDGVWVSTNGLENPCGTDLYRHEMTSLLILKHMSINKCPISQYFAQFSGECVGDESKDSESKRVSPILPTNDFLAAGLPLFLLRSGTHFGAELSLRLINFPNFVSL